MVTCYSSSDFYHPLKEIHFMEISKDQLENFLIEDIANGYILGANPFGKRIPSLEEVEYIDDTEDAVNETGKSWNKLVLENHPEVLMSTNLMLEDEQRISETTIGFIFHLQGEYNKDLLIFKAPRGTSSIVYDIYQRSLRWNIESLKDMNNVVVRKDHGYELIQDTYCIITNTENNTLLDYCIPSGSTQLIDEELDITSKGYVPTYLAAISGLKNPLKFTNMVINLINDKAWVPVTYKSKSNTLSQPLKVYPGDIIESRGVKFKCIYEATEDSDYITVSSIADFENNQYFIQL